MRTYEKLSAELPNFSTCIQITFDCDGVVGTQTIDWDIWCEFINDYATYNEVMRVDSFDKDDIIPTILPIDYFAMFEELQNDLSLQRAFGRWVNEIE